MSETPISFLLHHRRQVLDAYSGSPGEAWGRLVAGIQIDAAMKENTFRTIIKPFVETCLFYEAGLNAGLNETIDGLNNELNNERRLNNELNNQIHELNNRLNTLEGLNSRLNNVDTETVKSMNIEGWTVAKSGRYYRAFRKINGRVQGIHLGLTLDGAAEKIRAKAAQISVDLDA
jgi:hypothetical protein